MERRDLPSAGEPDMAVQNREIRMQEHAAPLPAGREAGA